MSDHTHPAITDTLAELTVLRRLSPIHVALTFRAPTIAAHARPGQFVHLRVAPGSTSPLLRRPFSVLGANRAAGTFRVLVRTIGRGTELLAELLPGTELPALGPLGMPFAPLPDERDTLLVAGGVGVAPLIFAATDAGRKPARALYGAGTAASLVLVDELGEHCREVALATDDGTAGYEGPVTDLVPASLDALTNPVALVCGPRPMMAAAAEWCAQMDVECYVSFEAWLGCGLGACLGCVIPAVGERCYVRVCCDGPVFRSDEVDWNALLWPSRRPPRP
jgi:dihydroorotate dehydrogenase electron transfer subunit